MPSCAGLLRILRRRLVLGLIFALSLTYCAFSLLRHERKGLPIETEMDDMDAMMINDNNEDLVPEDDTLTELRASGKPQSWQAAVLGQVGEEDGLNGNETAIDSCRNSIQGKVLIVDERGVVCARREVLSNGCCDLEQKGEERFSCKTCNPQGCCAIYEYCVSCCLHPGKQIKNRRDSIQHQQRVQKDEDVVKRRLRNLDRFQVCLAACRTSSASVRHENTKLQRGSNPTDKS